MGTIPALLDVHGAGGGLSENFVAGKPAYLAGTDEFSVTVTMTSDPATPVTVFTLRLTMSEDPDDPASWVPTASLLDVDLDTFTTGQSAFEHSIPPILGETVVARLTTANQGRTQAIRLEARTNGVPLAGDAVSAVGRYTP